MTEAFADMQRILPELAAGFPDIHALTARLDHWVGETPESLTRRFTAGLLLAFCRQEAEKGTSAARFPALARALEGPLEVAPNYPARPEWHDTAAGEGAREVAMGNDRRDLYAIWSVADRVLQRDQAYRADASWLSPLLAVVLSNVPPGQGHHNESAHRRAHELVAEGVERYGANPFAAIRVAEIGGRPVPGRPAPVWTDWDFQPVYWSTSPFVGRLFGAYHNHSGETLTGVPDPVNLDTWRARFPAAGAYDFAVTTYVLDQGVYTGRGIRREAGPEDRYGAASTFATCAALLKPGGMMMHRAKFMVDSVHRDDLHVTSGVRPAGEIRPAVALDARLQARLSETLGRDAQGRPYDFRETVAWFEKTGITRFADSRMFDAWASGAERCEAFGMEPARTARYAARREEAPVFHAGVGR